jgi:hypothetical protein
MYQFTSVKEKYLLNTFHPDVLFDSQGIGIV